MWLPLVMFMTCAHAPYHSRVLESRELRKVHDASGDARHVAQQCQPVAADSLVLTHDKHLQGSDFSTMGL